MSSVGYVFLTIFFFLAFLGGLLEAGFHGNYFSAEGLASFFPLFCLFVMWYQRSKRKNLDIEKANPKTSKRIYTTDDIINGRHLENKK